ncbi:SRPBCC domain-containing protein [Paenibacillus taiwanensis]|uniref:SRPBCC domain-containing protein n=1 Tax=Paenibacillus taiwanensis TaxID=401638 RepID=UPI0003FC73F9|nr:SRPBCC domain-containing protein [Paenibacillus taiwanensis]
MGLSELYYELYIAGSLEQVWDTIVSPAGTKAIYGGCIIESTFEKGAPFAYVGPGADGDNTVHVFGNILEYEPGHVFSITHKVGPSYYAGVERYGSRITYRLEAVGTCTKLELRHDQWHDQDPSYRNSARAWWMVLSSMKTLIETGKPLAF